MFAAGRFQIVPNTLKDAKTILKLNENDLYDEKMQDRIFEKYLIYKKRPKVMSYLKGDGDVEVAAYELAKEFASIGVKKGWTLNNGKIAQGGESFYSGVGGNKAHYSVEKIVEALKDTKEKYKNYIKAEGY